MQPADLLRLFEREFTDKVEHLGKIVKRNTQFPNAPNKIKIAIGMRRTGKTYFMYQHILKLLNEGVPRESILFINFEDDRLMTLESNIIAKLIDAFYEIHPENYHRKCYLFLDEIQNMENWALVIRRIHDTKNAEIFLTGSSSKMLSKEISTSLRGRSISTEVWPYSFQEYLTAKNFLISEEYAERKKLFESYLSQGGFPEITHYNAQVQRQTLQEYLDVAIYRDIIERHKVKNPELIKQMILTMTHYAAKPFSINKFFNDMKSRGYRVGKNSLYEYAEHIEDAYLSFGVTLHDKSIRRVQSNPKKLYMIDTGLTRAITLDYENDYGRLFENIVYLDLRRLGCKVEYYLSLKHYEIDFLATAPSGQKKLFQVAWHTQDPTTLERENRALDAAQKELHLEGEIVTLESYLEHGVDRFKQDP